MAYDGELRFDARMDASGFQKDCSKLGDIVKGLGIFNVLQKGFSMVTQSMDAAISRYDTLNKFPRVMEQMGYGAQAAEASMSKLSEGIQGLPTTLNDIVTNTQRLTVATGSLETGTDLALSLNNAFLASGASSEAASRGTEQYIQALSRGKMEMEEWRTLQETMPYALQTTAEAFGFAGTTAQSEFYAALQSGEITMTQVSEKLIELNSQTGGFAEVAKTATGGIGTAMTNLKTRTVAGVTEIVEAFDSGLSQTRFKSIENIINSASEFIKDALTSVAGAVEVVAANFDLLVPAAGIVGGLFVAFKAYKVVGSATDKMKTFKGVVDTARAAILASEGAVLSDVASHTLLTAALASETTAEKVRTAAQKAGMTIDAAGNLITASGTVATEAETAAVLKSAGALSAKTVLTGVLTGTVSLATAAQWAWNAAMSANPIGLVIAAVVALVAVIVGLVSWLGKGSAEFEDQKKEIEELSDAHEEYTAQLEEDKKAAQDELVSKKAQIETNRQVAASIQDLIAANDASGKNNEAIISTVENLNSSIEGLGLAYDSTTNTLNMTNDELEKYLDNLESTTVYEAHQTEYNRLLSEESDLKQKIRMQQDKEKEYAKLLEEKSITQSEYNKLMDESGKLLDEYGATLDDLSIDVLAAKGAMEDAYDAEAAASVKAQNIRNNEMDQVKEYANTYGVSVDTIIAEASRLQGGLEEWAENAALLYTEEGKHISDVAVQWGTTVDAIEQQLSEQNISLEEWETQQEEILEEWNNAVQENKDLIINGMKELPTEMDYTLDEMIAIMNENAEKYNAWREKMVEVSSQLTPEVMSYLEQLGPGTSQILDEIIADTSGTKAEELNAAFSNVGSAAVSGMESTYPELAGVGGKAVDTMSQGVAENNALSEATVTKLEDAQTAVLEAVEETDFGAIGQKIAEDIVSGVAESDMSGISDAVSDAIRDGAKDTAPAVNALSTALKNGFGKAKTDVQQIVSEMMTGVVKSITSRNSAVESAADGITSRVLKGLTPLKSKSGTIASEAMSGIIQKINGKKSAAQSSASGIASKVESGLKPMVSEGRDVADNMMDAMLSAMDSGKWSLYNKANLIAQTIIATLKGAFQIHSPSRVMIDIFTNLMKGAMLGFDKNETALYRQVDELADGITAKFELFPAEFAQVTADRLRATVNAFQSMAMQRIPSVVYPGVQEAATAQEQVIRQGDTFIFNDPVETPAAHARAVKQAVREALYGY